MSFLIEKQFFDLFLQKTTYNKLSDIYHNLKELLGDWDFQIDKDGSLRTITTELQSFKFKNIHYMVKLELKQSPTVISIRYFILQNNIPLKIQSRLHRIKLYSLFMKINSKITFGKFSICPKSGLILYNYECLVCQNLFQEIKSFNPKLKKDNIQIIHKIESNFYLIETFLFKILSSINFSKILIQNQSESPKTSKNINQNRYERQFTLFQKLLPFTHHSFNNLIKTNFQVKQTETIFGLDLIKEILSVLSNKNVSTFFEVPAMTSEKIAQITLLSRMSSYNTVNRQKIFKTSLLFEKDSIIKVKSISKNPNSLVELFCGLRVNPNQQKDKNIFHFIKKTASSLRGEKLIQREKKFIDLLIQNGNKHNIAEYFQINTLQGEVSKRKPISGLKVKSWQEGSIFMAYYPSNIYDYVSKRREFMSFNSKVLLLLKIQKALSYLLGEGSQHMDLKPENIMVDNQQNIRLIDFGQSIHQMMPLNSKPGVSIPYSPPQFFSKYKFVPDRCDVYSLGVIIFQILIGEIPQNLPSRKEKALLYYQSSNQYTKLFQFQPEKLQHYIQKDLGQLITGFCLKCMHENASFRPLQSWIRVYLKKFIQLSCKY